MTSTPDDQEPLDDWAALTKKALTGRAAVPKQAPARAGFLEHFTAALVGGVNPTGPLGELDGKGETARKAMVIIDPFPADEKKEPAGMDIPPSAPLGVVGAAAKLLRAWINQAR